MDKENKKIESVDKCFNWINKCIDSIISHNNIIHNPQSSKDNIMMSKEFIKPLRAGLDNVLYKLINDAHK